MSAEKQDGDKGRQRLYYLVTILLTIGVVLFALFMPPTIGVGILVAVLVIAAIIHIKKSKK